MSHTPDLDRRFHQEWLGLVQPVDGLVVSVPVLVDAQVGMRRGPDYQADFVAHTAVHTDGRRVVPSVRALLTNVLRYRADEALPLEALEPELADALTLNVPEAHTRLSPTAVLCDPGSAQPTHQDDPHRVAARFGVRALVMEVALGQGLDAPLDEAWRYPPTARLERLLRHTRVPLGVISNGSQLRLVFAPHGESTGSITFGVDDMTSVAGRAILDGMAMLLEADRVLDRDDARSTAGLCRASRLRQADVTNTLAGQVFEALEVLLAGFEAAERRDGNGALEAALGEPGEPVYQGLLTVLLRLVFGLFAEDQALLPVEHPVFADHLSLTGLFARLQADAAEHPDAMDRRFGAWAQLCALFRAIYDGLDAGDLAMPARRGRLFDPDRFAFLEGRTQGSTVGPLPDERAAVRLPSIDDGTVLAVLERLLMLDGQRLSYRALDVEQIGSVYERLMGYHVQRLGDPSACLKPARVWVSALEVCAQPAALRARWFKDECGVPKARAEQLARRVEPLCSAGDLAGVLEVLRGESLEVGAPGRLVLQPGSERRRTSSHYTPRSLSSRVVQRTLEPVLRALGEQPSPEQILSLKICDPAMGSGAFLVETCRWLADALVASWTRTGSLPADVDPVLHARRAVAQRCLYGVDRNPFAVDLARLSLWLVTLARDLPFTFVDHALRHGDTLVGLGVSQIRALHWEPAAQQSLVQRELDAALDEAIALRVQILEMAERRDAQAVRHKQWLLQNADEALERIRLLADATVGAFFAGVRPADRRAALGAVHTATLAWLGSGAPLEPPATLLQAQQALRGHTPAFHWPLEFPEVFTDARPDPLDGNRVNRAAAFDAFVGNPPFAGKNAITATGGPLYIEWLQVIHPGAHGNADLSAHFFRRAATWLGRHGTIGLIATNTIGQGDTRATGLQALVNSGHAIYAAESSFTWPGDAAVTASIAHLATGNAAQHVGPLWLDGRVVASIGSALGEGAERPDPLVLAANAGKSFQGAVVLGMGFTLTPEERAALVAHDPRNAERIFPYLGGQEVNSHPRQEFDRYVINFGQMSLDDARRWPDLIAIVEQRVKPARDQLHGNTDADKRRENWWLYGRYTPAMFAAIAPLDRCLVTARVSKHLMFSLQPTDRVLNEKLYVFPTSSMAQFGLLQSRVHVPWAWKFSSTLETRLNYSASDCFETFPFPPDEAMAPGGALEVAGEALYAARAALMEREWIGLTDLYNRLHDPNDQRPEVASLRALHQALDQAVLQAYGWDDLAVPPYGTTPDPAVTAAQAAFEHTLIDRLWDLNTQRAEQERLLGQGKGAKAGKGAKKAAKAGDEGGGQVGFGF